MSNDQEALGALNLYSAEPHAYDSDSVDLALVFASHAATAISNAELVTGLQTALQSRHLIGVAQGILMAQYDMGLETAFEVLRRYSSHTNVKLRDVALRVVELRSLPEDYADLEVAREHAIDEAPDASPEPSPAPEPSA
jgi:GAF domain-containing protein